MSTLKPLITILSASSKQGSSILTSLLKNPSFRLRSTTRNPTSEHAQSFVSKGVELVKADLASADDVANAIRGSWGLFLNLNSHDQSIEGREFKLSKQIVDLAAQAGVKSIVYSSLPGVEEATNGEISIATFDEKYKTQRYILQKQSEAPGSFSATFVQASWYFENFHSTEFGAGFPFVANSDGVYTIQYPSVGPPGSRMGFIDVAEDFGALVHGAFLDPKKWDGKIVQGASEFLSYQELAETFEKVTGKEAAVDIIPNDAFETHGLQLLEETKNMFVYAQKMDGKYFASKDDNSLAKELKRAVGEAIGGETDLGTWEKWLRNNLPSA